MIEIVIRYDPNGGLSVQSSPADPIFLVGLLQVVSARLQPRFAEEKPPSPIVGVAGAQAQSIAAQAKR